MLEEKLSILVIDDNPQNLKLSRFLLEAAAFKVITAPDAENALALVEDVTPALILVDIQLPGMDGLELTRRLRKIERLSNTSIIALTAYAMKGDEEKAFDAGCNGYITKPIDTRSFASTVRGYLPQTKPSEAGKSAIPSNGLDMIRQRFFEVSRQSVAEMLADSNWVSNPKSKTYLHQIAGAGGAFGAHDVSSIAATAEDRLRQQSNESASESLGELLLRLKDALDSADASQLESDLSAGHELKD